MTTSRQFEFDYLVEAQTQKHLTVNNALARIDACSQLIVRGDVGGFADKRDGDVFSQTGSPELAIFLNGGLEYVAPKTGWRAYFLAEQKEKRFDGNIWVAAADKPQNRIEKLVDLSLSDPLIIPEKSMVFGITARVKEGITGAGSLASWRIGVAEDAVRYGQGLWLGQNGWSRGLTGVPITYWSDTPVLISGEGGAIMAGKIQLYLYLQTLEVPEEF